MHRNGILNYTEYPCSGHVNIMGHMAIIRSRIVLAMVGILCSSDIGLL